MTTPGHAILSWIVLGRTRAGRGHDAALLAGAVLPDLSLFVFYLFERLGRGQSEREIWSHGYYDASWQAVFDLFHSLPLIALLILLACWAGRWAVAALGSSMALHSLCDLLLHNDDAHRHFYPLSNWRFESPLSYWDPAHYGHLFAVIEALLVVFGALYLLRQHRSAWARASLSVVALPYLLFLLWFPLRTLLWG